MDFDLLRTFVAICDNRTFTAAAQRVGRTQSAVSLQMRRLEESLGRPPFVREGARPGLTEHGVLLLALAGAFSPASTRPASPSTAARSRAS